MTPWTSTPVAPSSWAENYTGYAMGHSGGHHGGRANILTRNLMIFGQGATRCHPYVFAELEAAADTDVERGLEKFDALLMKHIAFGTGNFFGALFQGLTQASSTAPRWLAKPPATTSSSPA